MRSTALPFALTGLVAEKDFQTAAVPVDFFYAKGILEALFDRLGLEVTYTALITITKSPVSVCGVNVGLFFPRSTLATTAERRPRGTSVASTTYHLRSTWPGLAMNVVLFMISPI